MLMGVVKEENIDGQRMKLTTRCPNCKETSEIIVSIKGVIAYNSGALIQSAFPELTEDERERMISGYDQKCWDHIFDDDYAEEKEEE